ncbi:peptide deformylase [Spongiimicrobium salis]|uniref:peptide deformylase n=1 Tax=Spongiimicrobium salis TaxID=1667022 RepID=UPI00374CB442
MPKLDVIKMGNPKLRELSKEVSLSRISTPEFREFLKNLIHTMRMESGAGIAAPQVAVMERVFVMEMKDNVRYPNKESFPLYTAINPSITPLDDQWQDSWEGCLSIPNIRGKLRRHAHIELKAYDETGRPYTQELSGFAAVVAQHELDHLNGILLIDRMESMETLTFYEEFQKYWQ